jgi:hypothetical protein
MDMKEAYLEMTFHRGRPIAAYYYLPRRRGQKSYKSVPVEAGMVVDLGRNGEPLGVEITAPSLASPANLNRVFKQFGLPPVKAADLQPLRVA